MNNCPDSVRELFENEEAEYRYQDYSSNEMDNNQSMSWFFDYIGATPENIDFNDGTQMGLVHPDFDFKLCIDSSGFGDFHSHKFEVSKY